MKKIILLTANFKNVVEPILCTKISNKNGVTVSTVEHLMAAFFGEGIDNALVELMHLKFQFLMAQQVNLLKQSELLVLKNNQLQDNLSKLKKKLK